MHLDVPRGALPGFPVAIVCGVAAVGSVWVDMGSRGGQAGPQVSLQSRPNWTRFRRYFPIAMLGPGCSLRNSGRCCT
jgi:hypothetical protein